MTKILELGGNGVFYRKEGGLLMTRELDNNRFVPYPFRVTCNSLRDEIDKNGDSTEVGVNVPLLDFRKKYIAPIDGSYYGLLGSGKVSTLISSHSELHVGINITIKDLDNNNSLVSTNGTIIRCYVDNTGVVKIRRKDSGGGFGTFNLTHPTIIDKDLNYSMFFYFDIINGTAQLSINGVEGDLINVVSYFGNITSLVFGEATAFDSLIGNIYKCEAWNIKLTSQQLLDRFNGLTIPNEYKGANNFDFTAGFFTVGKQYRIATAGTTDFTLIGSVDSNVGTEFTATGVGAGTGTATSIGNTLNLSTGKTAAIWYDLDHSIEGAVSSATLSNSTDFGSNLHETEACPVLLTEPSFTNYFLNSRTPITQIVPTVIGTEYTINCKGEGIATFDEVGGNGIGGAFTEVYPHTYIATGTSVTVTLVGGHSFDFVQLTNTKYAMNHVETLGTSVTRAKDEVNSSGDVNTFDSTSGVLEVEISALFDDITSRAISISDGTSSNAVIIQYTPLLSNELRADVVVGGIGVYTQPVVVDDITNVKIVKLKWASSDFGMKVDGIEIGSQQSGNIFAEGVLNTCQLDSGGGGGELFARTKGIRAYKGIDNY